MSVPLPDFSTGRVVVVGDVMLDRYWHGSTNRISPEAPVPIVRVEQDEFRAGGAGNVAINVASLGARADIVGLIGHDEAGTLLRHRLEDAGVACRLIEAPHHPTITKLRIISRHQQLIRLDFEESFAVLESAGIEAECDAALPGAGALVLSDYGKGTLAQVGSLIRAAREAGVPVVVDPKGTDFGRYCGASVITPNLSEFEAVVGHCANDEVLVERGEALREALDLQAVLITRSERGMTLIARAAAPLTLPARARDVFDVTGAGDTVVALLGAGLACGLPLAEATLLANVAAGIVVGKLGTASVSPEELLRGLEQAPTGETA
ncbi:D-glycero-beta-D-manno-heptose-7-phosphate kinase [Pseudazoarcus pumilus]|uniref:D-glycero-beta-D-manno-heptose-7-phosphate kinase n=1 Tax=Pseudazoarcus pumilus TaxID=2067960 RepID=A0A2I6S8V1_9RHOO|nr:D-glycero-beta-D-manno-heptose-7-phosphate kinase [Pseudazoarcus pumilus]AUN95678.1 D-glycero-beta-D-manno-heptose-7-phosphate kinase [Pseudazoarcus pumilus]